MKIVNIELEQGHYPVYIGHDVLQLLHHVLNQKKTILIITDQHVSDLYLNNFIGFLDGYRTFTFNMGNSEENKNLNCYEACVQFALNHHLDRDVQVIALGGGAVGDFAGFFASTYKRGVKFIQCPTTLLAHDSAVGGKVAVNVGGVKNVVGTFYQPSAVIYNTHFLKSLPIDEIKSGFGEVFKHDLLHDGSIFNTLINHKCNLLELVNDYHLIEEILYRCIEIKRHYIINDVFDQKGIRQALNLGHTLGHAIEMLYDVTHGEAVAFGICFELYLSENPHDEFYFKQLKNLGYFTQKQPLNIEKMIEIMKNDKKNKNGLITFIGLKELGKPYEIHLTDDEIQDKLTNYLNIIKNW